MNEYIRTPHADISDPLEVRIRNVINGIVQSTNFGANSLSLVRSIQKKYLTEALNNLNQESKIYKYTQDVLDQISRATNSTLVEGKELLANITKGSPVFAAVNHFGINKLTTLTPEEIGLQEGELKTSNGKPVKEIYPFTMYYAALKPIAQILDVNMSEAHLVLPGNKLSKLQEEAGLIVIPQEKGEFRLITERTNDLIKKHPNSLMVIFPEGETSGKRNQSHPYDLLPFHAGLWGIATELAKNELVVPIITAYQYWNPEKGFEIGVVNVDIPNPNDSREEIKTKANVSQEKMQLALNRKLQETS